MGLPLPLGEGKPRTEEGPSHDVRARSRVRVSNHDHQRETDGVVIIVAVPLAALGAVAFSAAAVLQGRAVRSASEGRALDPGTWLRAARRPAWVGGVLCSLVGAVAGVVALTLAPVSLIQPIGVVAVPLAVLLSARLSGVRPQGRVWGCAALCMVGVAVFVAVSAGGAATTATGAAAAGVAAAFVLMVVAGLSMLGAAGPQRWQCPANAAAAATCFGAMCVLIKVASTAYVAGGLAGWAHPAALMVLAGIVAAGGAGAWLCQRAYAVGPPEVVLGCLTVLDPVVAVMLGRLLLGEGAHQGAISVALLVVGAGAAVAGVAGLTRLHPAARCHHRASAAPPVTPATSSADLTPPVTRTERDAHRLERTPTC